MNINKDKLESWLHNDVTKRFLRDIMLELKECRECMIFGKSTEEILKQVHERNAKIQALEYILNWASNELQSNDGENNERRADY